MKKKNQIYDMLQLVKYNYKVKYEEYKAWFLFVKRVRI